MKVLNGKIISENMPVQHVIIENLASKKNTSTDLNGEFKLAAKLGDSLKFTHVALKEITFSIEKVHFEQNPFVFDIQENMNIELDEVELTHYSKVTAESVGLITKKMEKLTMNEKRLRTAGDFKAADLLNIFQGSLPIEPIINKISGRTKRMKRNIELDRKMDNFEFLEKNYSDFLMDLGLTEEEIGGFLYYLVDQDSIQALISENHDGKLKFFISEWWFKYKEIQAPE